MPKSNSHHSKRNGDRRAVIDLAKLERATTAARCCLSESIRFCHAIASEVDSDRRPPRRVLWKMLCENFETLEQAVDQWQDTPRAVRLAIETAAAGVSSVSEYGPEIVSMTAHQAACDVAANLRLTQVYDGIVSVDTALDQIVDGVQKRFPQWFVRDDAATKRTTACRIIEERIQQEFLLAKSQIQGRTPVSLGGRKSGEVGHEKWRQVRSILLQHLASGTLPSKVRKAADLKPLRSFYGLTTVQKAVRESPALREHFKPKTPSADVSSRGNGTPLLEELIDQIADPKTTARLIGLSAQRRHDTEEALEEIEPGNRAEIMATLCKNPDSGWVGSDCREAKAARR